VTACFVRLRDLNYGWFSVSAGFVPVIRFQRQSVLFLCSFTRFQRQSALIRYEISMMVGFVWLRDLNDGRFSVSISFVLL